MSRGTFLDRNKKKSALAALLLFLRQRKILVLLLLLLLIASTVFLSPSSWLTGLPGGERFAAGVAWVAGKRGGAGGAAGAGVGAGEDSLRFVKGSKSDLEHGVGAGSSGGGQSVAGIVDPADPKGRGGDAVALSEADLGGRSGYVDGVNGSGFSGRGGPGAGGGPGDGSLSGGAFASKGFFSGTGGAAGTSNGLAKAGLASVGAIATPASAKGGAAKGALSAFASRGVEARATKGVMAAGSVGGNLAYTQLAEGGARSSMVMPDCQGVGCCKPPSCPVEFASSGVGAIFDGNTITSGLLTSNDPGGNSSGLINSSVDVPPVDGGGSGGGAGTDAAHMQKCANLVQTCQQQKTATMPQVGADENKLQPMYNAIPGACGDPCNCDQCNSLKSQIGAVCADLKTQLAAADKPCAPLPDYCAALGFTPAQFDPSAAGAYCQSDFGECGPKGYLAQLACLLGS